MRHHQPTNPLELMAILVAMLIIVAVTSCSLAGSPSARPTLIPTTTSANGQSASASLPPSVTSPLGSPPSDCPTSPPPHIMTSSDFGGGFIGTVTFGGASPAWQLGMGADGVVPVTGTPYPGTKIMWVVGPNYNQAVTLSGHDLRSGSPLWFDLFPPNKTGTDEYGTSAVLDPTMPNRGDTMNSTGTWNIWGIGLIVSAASCYELDVTSAAGSWRTDFAAGTVQ